MRHTLSVTLIPSYKRSIHEKKMSQSHHLRIIQRKTIRKQKFRDRFEGYNR